MVVHTCNPSTREAEVGGSRVQSQPGLHRKSLSQKQTSASSLCHCEALSPVGCEPLPNAGYAPCLLDLVNPECRVWLFPFMWPLFISMEKLVSVVQLQPRG
jgi:hypothetical protein